MPRRVFTIRTTAAPGWAPVAFRAMLDRVRADYAPTDARGRAGVLVTGMSGRGKSTALAELARRGHRVIDSDDQGWIVEAQTAAGPEPMWDLDRLAAFLDSHLGGWLFIAGCVANQRTLYHRFNAVVLLSAPVEVILARVASRANPFGSTADDRAKIAADLMAYEPLLRAGANHEFDTTRPVMSVVDALEQVAAKYR